MKGPVYILSETVPFRMHGIKGPIIHINILFLNSLYCMKKFLYIIRNIVEKLGFLIPSQRLNMLIKVYM